MSKNILFFCEKVLDKSFKVWYNMQAVIPKAAKHGTWAEKPWKKFEKKKKTFQKGIDKAKEKWYNNRAAAKTAEMILENWTTREKYKAYKSMCNGSRTIQTRILLKQK